MKNPVLGALLLAGLCASASALTRIGETAELFVTGSLNARADDNVFLSDIEETDDTIFELTPGLRFVFGQGALFNGSIEAGETFIRFLDNDNLDDELFSAAVSTRFDDAKTKILFDLSFRELNQSTRDVRGATLIRRDVISSRLDSQVSLSDKSSVVLGIAYEDTDYADAAYIDIRETAFPLNYYYSISEKIDLSAGVRYRRTGLTGNSNYSEDFYYNLGARGDFTPKFSGYFSVGFNQRELDAGGDESSVGALADLAYLVTEKTALALSVINDFRTSVEGISQKSLSITPSIKTSFNAQWEGAAALTFQSLEYFNGREDDYLEASVRVAYRVSTQTTLSASYHYRTNDSTLAFTDGDGRRRSADFDNSLIQLGASVRF